MASDYLPGLSTGVKNLSPVILRDNRLEHLRAGDVASRTSTASTAALWFAGGSRVSAQKLGWEYLGEVQAYDLTTETTSVVLRMGPGQYEVGTVSWAPSGDRMALNYRRYEVNFLWTVAMVDAGGDAADATIAVSGDMDVDRITWSPAGKHLLVRMGCSSRPSTWLINTSWPGHLIAGVIFPLALVVEVGILYVWCRPVAREITAVAPAAAAQQRRAEAAGEDPIDPWARQRERHRSYTRLAR